MQVLETLKSVEALQEVPESQLQWLIDKGQLLNIKNGEHLFKPGDPINKLFVILSGSFIMKVQRNNQFQVVGRFGSLTVTGMLPYSRANQAIGFGEAVEDACVLQLMDTNFDEMIKSHHELTTALVHVMSSRIRQFTKQEQQNDKMLALGKLSAGLAHELNNPSAAVVRSSQELARHLKFSPDRFKAILKVDLTDDEIDKVNEILYGQMQQEAVAMSMMEKSSLEDELLDWLDDHDIDDADEMAAVFVESGLNADHLDEIEETLDDEAKLYPSLQWMAQVMSTEKLVNEIEDAAQRINELVSSVKSYTHMDQAPEKVPTDIHEGIKNTLTMLNHKIKHLELVLDFADDLPKIEILAGPMNQVWTNLIDNAVDAMEDQPKQQLTITTKRDGEFVNVEIEDTGSGISQDIQDKVFDPFFTTKAIGKGTGLGLEFVQQIIKKEHNGAVYLESEPGKTCFTICLPIK